MSRGLKRIIIALKSTGCSKSPGKISNIKPYIFYNTLIELHILVLSYSPYHFKSFWLFSQPGGPNMRRFTLVIGIFAQSKIGREFTSQKGNRTGAFYTEWTWLLRTHLLKFPMWEISCLIFTPFKSLLCGLLNLQLSKLSYLGRNEITKRRKIYISIIMKLTKFMEKCLYRYKQHRENFSTT